jgi:AcrR family transcriptional regulator
MAASRTSTKVDVLKPPSGESARQRLLDAATHLFCRYGINATGVDAVIAEARTAKTTLYKLFGSKECLIEAVLEGEGERWREWFIGTIDRGNASPQARIGRIFPALKTWFGEERFYGCPFINAVGEHDKHQDRLRAITIRHKKIVLRKIEDLVVATGAHNAGALAHQIGLLIDGAIIAAMVTRDPRVADAAGDAVRALLERHVAAPRRRNSARSVSAR